MAAPVIRDTAFNPSDPNGVVATFSFTGGGRSVISYDGGQTYYTFAGGGANSISWWKGANEGSGASEQGRNWILTGSLTGGGFSGRALHRRRVAHRSRHRQRCARRR